MVLGRGLGSGLLLGLGLEFLSVLGLGSALGLGSPPLDVVLLAIVRTFLSERKFGGMVCG